MTELLYTVPVTGEKVTLAEPLVDTALTEIKTVVNGKISAVNLEALAVGGAAVKAELTGLRLLDRQVAMINQNTAAGTYIFKATGTTLTKLGGGSEGKFSGNAPDLAFYQPSKFAVAGKTTKGLLLVSAYTNAVAPVASFTVGLYALETVKGAGSELEIKYEAVVAASETKITTPAKEVATAAETTFTFPAEKHYSLGVVLSAETVVNSGVGLTVELFVKNE